MIVKEPLSLVVPSEKDEVLLGLLAKEPHEVLEKGVASFVRGADSGQFSEFVQVRNSRAFGTLSYLPHLLKFTLHIGNDLVQTYRSD